MFYSIQLLKDKKKELESFETESELAKTANNILLEDINKAIKTLEYESIFKGMTEKQIDQYYRLKGKYR